MEYTIHGNGSSNGRKWNAFIFIFTLHFCYQAQFHSHLTFLINKLTTLANANKENTADPRGID